MSHNREVLNRTIAIIEDYRLGVSDRVIKKITRDYKSAPPPPAGEFLLPSINIGRQKDVAFERLCVVLASELSELGLNFEPRIFDLWVKVVGDDPYDSVMSCKVEKVNKGFLKRNMLLQETLWWLILEPARCYRIGEDGLVLPGVRCSETPQKGKGEHCEYGAIMRQKDKHVFIDTVKYSEILPYQSFPTLIAV